MAGKNELLEVTFKLSLAAIDFCELSESKRKYVISKQLPKSATSIGANSREAQGAECAADFVYKLKIAYKEAEETTYWLALCQYSEHYSTPPTQLQQLNLSAKRLLGKIIATSNRNRRK